MADNENRRRSGWLWLWLALFVIALMVILLWAWPAREPPAGSHNPVTPTRVEAAERPAGAVMVDAARTAVVAPAPTGPLARSQQS